MQQNTITTIFYQYSYKMHYHSFCCFFKIGLLCLTALAVLI